MGPASRFTPYPKVREVAAGAGGGMWVASEKLHGANLALVATADGVALAKRREVLTPAAMPAFFGVHRLWPALAAGARAAFASVPGAHALTLYGELVGGAFPGWAGEPGGPVQTGIAYAPKLVWCGFDALLAVDEGPGRWLGADERTRVLAAGGLLAVPELARGSLTALRRLPTVFPSRLPAQLGLAAPAGNDAEGFVLTPAASESAAAGRTAEKHKQARFAEDERYAGARPSVVGDDLDAELAELAQLLLTPARGQAARSKTGRDLAAGVAALVADVLEEVDERTGGVDPGSRTRLTAALQPAAEQLMRER